MELFGLPLETIYLYTLIISGSLTFLYILFGDIFEGIFGGSELVNPTLALSYLTIFSASAYLLEFITSFNSLLIILIAVVGSLVLVTLLNVFVLIPLLSAEESLAYTESDLIGRIGRVITSIPVDGFGEVLIDSNSGAIAKPAASLENQAIGYDQRVLVLDIKNGVLYVELFESLD